MKCEQTLFGQYGDEFHKEREEDGMNFLMLP